MHNNCVISFKKLMLRLYIYIFIFICVYKHMFKSIEKSLKIFIWNINSHLQSGLCQYMIYCYDYFMIYVYDYFGDKHSNVYIIKINSDALKNTHKHTISNIYIDYIKKFLTQKSVVWIVIYLVKYRSLGSNFLFGHTSFLSRLKFKMRKRENLPYRGK